MNKLIGITGRTGLNGIAGCGKDTAAKIISEFLGYKIYGFADPLYDMIQAGFGIDGHSEEWQDRVMKNATIPWLSSQERDISLRYLLETLGTAWGRHRISNDIWIKVANKFINDNIEGVIIHDVRFSDEFVWIKEKGGVIIHIIRPNYFGNDATINHPSNIPLPILEDDKVIVNDGSLSDFKKKIKILLEEMNYEFKSN